jgi:hypothetical protein
VTVRFETAETGPGPVRTFAWDDGDLVPRRVGEQEDATAPAPDAAAEGTGHPVTPDGNASQPTEPNPVTRGGQVATDGT